MASIIGMFEQNNIEIDVPSPLEIYLDELSETEHKSFQEMGILRDLATQAAEWPLEVCLAGIHTQSNTYLS